MKMIINLKVLTFKILNQDRMHFKSKSHDNTIKFKFSASVIQY